MKTSQEFENYFEANRALWDAKVPFHLNSGFYDLEAFKGGETSLRKLELDEVGEVSGKSLLHLQCHFGMDTLSWAREGAVVTGMDFSKKAIEAARDLAVELHVDARFVCCNLYDLPDHLEESFDIVFSSYGTITWLPDIDRWAEIVAHFLKPGGMFYLAEFHPVVWMYDDDIEKITYSYFNKGVEMYSSSGTYADKDAPLQMDEYFWLHPIGSVATALIKQGLRLAFIHEFPYTNIPCFDRLIQLDEQKYVFEHIGEKMPYLFSIKAIKGE